MIAASAVSGAVSAKGPVSGGGAKPQPASGTFAQSLAAALRAEPLHPAKHGDQKTPLAALGLLHAGSALPQILHGLGEATAPVAHEAAGLAGTAHALGQFYLPTWATGTPAAPASQVPTGTPAAPATAYAPTGTPAAPSRISPTQTKAASAAVSKPVTRAQAALAEQPSAARVSTAGMQSTQAASVKTAAEAAVQAPITDRAPSPAPAAASAVPRSAGPAGPNPTHAPAKPSHAAGSQAAMRSELPQESAGIPQPGLQPGSGTEPVTAAERGAGMAAAHGEPRRIIANSAPQDVSASLGQAQQVPLTSQAHGLSHEVSVQIADAARAEAPHVQPGGASMVRIALTPPELGHVNVTLRAGVDGLSAVLRAEEPAAAALLQLGQGELRQRLEALGLGRAHVEVSTQDQNESVRPARRSAPGGRS